MAVWSGRKIGRNIGRKSARRAGGGDPRATAGEGQPTRTAETAAGAAAARAAAVTPAVPTTGWLLKGRDGRLTAYVPVPGKVLRWTEKLPGGPHWLGPDEIPAPDIDPYLSIAQGANGYVYLAALRRRTPPEGPETTEVVYAVQYQSGLGVRDWAPLGSPYPKQPELAAKMGAPAVVVDSAGSAHIFIKNAYGGLCSRSQAPNGKWHNWADHKGRIGIGSVSAGIGEDGLMEFALPTRDAVMRWTQETKGLAFRRADDIPLKVLPDSIAIHAAPGSGLTYHWRSAAAGTLDTWDPGATSPATVDPGAGTDRVALLRTRLDGAEHTVMAQRDPSGGRAAYALVPAGDETREIRWTLTGEPVKGAPALNTDALGRIVLAVCGTDGRLRIARARNGGAAGFALDAWTRI
jgi:hypothetical protein